ncbi:MAG: pyridoxal-phosphate dependent enzyme [Vulcanimicrobiaceae bacterium]
MLTLSRLRAADITAAAEAMRDAVDCTPCARSAELSALIDAEVVIKYENLQRTGSFKVRGAFTKLHELGANERRCGVVTASAGNHAQGVAYHARRMGIEATIVMPAGTPVPKVRATEQWGAQVVLTGDTVAHAMQAAHDLADRDHLTFVHPYDDPDVIAGQGTVALEMLHAFPDLDTLVVPVGGGGLIAGMAVAAKSMSPLIEIVGVQSEERAGRTTVAEGIAVAQLGELPQRIVAENVDDLVVVSDPHIERALHYCLESLRTVVEGAGAASVAALLAQPDRFRGKRVGVVLSGGTIDIALLSSIAARARLIDGRVVRTRVQIVDAPGGLARVAGVIAEHAGNIVEVVHQRALHDLPAKCVALDITVDLRRPPALDAMIAALRCAGFPTNLLAMETAHD